MRNNKGITLIIVIMTVILLAILAGLALKNGMDTFESSKVVKFESYMKVIQKEVGLLVEDISRLDDRIENLGKHFDMASKDIGDIKISSGKIARRIDKIEDIELGENSEKHLAVEDLTGHRGAEEKSA